MEKIPASRNKWVKNQLTWFRDNIDNMDALRERALNLKNNVIDKRNLVYLLNKMSAVEIIAESHGVVCDIKSDILDLTCHTATKKKVKGNKSIHDPEGYRSWISLFCLAMQFDVKLLLQS